MFKYLKLKAEIEALQQENYDLHNTVTCLIKEISRRDQKISDLIQQNVSKNLDSLNFEFPGTEKSFEGFWDKFKDHINT